ncbi:hypothetical protein CDD80_6012 [Ophiocordyceps camponoti-rufipedis]|uniref:Uncharacterized protein n=1 Tax=Ophiocordyceps camponoti-rufipedis TaxID=2004952 RepID=A0A2C5YRR6_9HYPO|nr:hypothetical protein CDD80_6012 [Ophiocordyceps camponoti-rufipedis]
MKILLALLGILASSASASAPFRHLHFPRNNGTNYLSPNAPLVTGTSPEPGYGSVPSGGGDGGDETVTATMTSTLHQTRTSYVHGMATSASAIDTGFKAVIPGVNDAEADPEADTDPLSTTTVTSKTFTTVTLSRAPGAGAGSAPDSECASPATVTVTQPAVTQTVFVTASPDASSAPDSPDDTRTLSSQAYRPHTTVQSVVTVMPYPTGRNGSDPVVGAPRPTGYARLRRWM